MERMRRKVAWTASLIFCAVVPAYSQFGEEATKGHQSFSPSCNAAQIDPESYALTIRAQAAIVDQDRLNWWDGFNVGSAFQALPEPRLRSASGRPSSITAAPLCGRRRSTMSTPKAIS